ncbi:thiol reductase thioredoxin [Brevibacillus agri]|uniref:Thioredoxin n=1 Tax=Brevibacillus agri TaxID=51101 RepID=A0A3M8AZW8_9BACL|nr:thioredoxin family protein [Brevibacillus agri]HAJ4019678.1 thiol reductase thioredoxin [Escherichia coli]MBY0053099.1 thioredoxin family protein [Brevibacillus agri]MCG5253306.1 thioredoxin family protein [Brevibacillus agri]MDR9506032.1 thioredoxin family protein [Brevibacillus agri]MED3498375.1 thioredoxin family protein [Brevibacillus agri]
MQEIDTTTLNRLCQQNKPFALFIYTPMCGTCKLAERMLHVTREALPEPLPLYQLNINTAAALAERLQITSVPALFLFRGEQVTGRHYALRSVGYLYDVLKTLV